MSRCAWGIFRISNFYIIESNNFFYCCFWYRLTRLQFLNHELENNYTTCQIIKHEFEIWDARLSVMFIVKLNSTSGLEKWIAPLYFIK